MKEQLIWGPQLNLDSLLLIHSIAMFLRYCLAPCIDILHKEYWFGLKLAILLMPIS